VDLKYSKSTDARHTIKLESGLIYAVWRTSVARAGGTAGFEVRTSFVGNGARIKITGKSDAGNTLGEIDGQIRNNKFIGEFDIPVDFDPDDSVFFEVKLPQNGLSGESNRILAAPAIDVTNLKWSAAEARRGDILTLSADVAGCRDGAEATVTIFEYDRDGVHDRIIQIPTTVTRNKISVRWQYEYHEDTDEIPTEEELQKYGRHYHPPEYFFVVDIDGTRFGESQESGLLIFKDWIEIRLADRNEALMPNEDYVLTLPDGGRRRGKLDGNGYARVDGIPPGQCTIDFPALGSVAFRRPRTEQER